MIEKDMKIILASGIGLTAAGAIAAVYIPGAAAWIVLALGAILTVLYCIETCGRYKRLKELNNYLSMICAGKYDLELGENKEGELSILQNNLYKVTVLLRTQNEKLQKDKVFLADSLADISHQFKTPLTSMMVMTELLKTEEDPEKRQEFLSVIDTQLEKMKWLITTLLKLSRLDAGTVTFADDYFSVHEMIRSALQPFLITMDLADISYALTGNDFQIRGDKSWTEEACGNIMKNCIEHMSAGGQLQISTQENSIYSELVIRDDGSGIAEEELPHIFERFYQGSNASPESIGIGLALSKTILEKERAKIEVSSKPGCGSEFRIRFYKTIV